MRTKTAEDAAVSNTNKNDELEIGIFSTYQQAFIEVKEIMKASSNMPSDFVALPKITQHHDGNYRVTLAVKKKKP